ncbi:flagellar hook-length control protein FliK [Candidatus Sumerlaeota bacterium]|nr:flagellar hook-length control protein FliK [Candidatus Sumerlaeota bacterium]
MTEEPAAQPGERIAPSRANSAHGSGRGGQGIFASIKPGAGDGSVRPDAKVNEPGARAAAMNLSGVEAARADSNGLPPMAMAPIEFQTGSRVVGESIALRGSSPPGQVTEIADFLASRVEGAVSVGRSEVQASIRMQPPELGLVRVELKVTSDGTVTTRFIAERAETGELLSQNIKQFTQALERHGLNVGKVQVSVEPKAASETLTRNNPETHGRNEGQPRDQQSRSAQDRPEARRDGREQFRRWEELLG